LFGLAEISDYGLLHRQFVGDIVVKCGQIKFGKTHSNFGIRSIHADCGETSGKIKFQIHEFKSSSEANPGKRDAILQKMTFTRHYVKIV